MARYCAEIRRPDSITQGPTADVCLIPAPSRKKQAQVCDVWASSVYSRHERVIRTGLADNVAGQEFMSFKRLKRMNLDFLSQDLRTRSLRDRRQSTVLKHGASRTTHCYAIVRSRNE